MVAVTAANHRVDVSGGVVERDETALRSGVLLKRDFGMSVGTERDYFHVRDVAGREYLLRRLALRPRHIFAGDPGSVARELHGRERRAGIEHERMHVAS